MKLARNKILTSTEIQAKVERIAHEIHEQCYQEQKLFLVGIEGRGFDFAKRLQQILISISKLEITVLQIKLNKDNPLAQPIELSPEKISDKSAMILVDDVLNSGKPLAFAAAFLLQRNPKILKTAILVNREHHRFPITADFVGISLTTTLQETIEVEFGPSEGVYLV